MTRQNKETMDVKALASRLGLEEDDIYDVLALFIQTAPADITKLEAACNSRDTVLAGQAAHSLKGSVGTLGFMDISELAQQIMALSRENKIDDLSRSVPPFLGRMKDLLRDIRHLLANR